ncbi:broad-complex core protein isoforms 1/2/3/4/5-like isoform X12 [Penaeus indicus]|uniref:broad-complex core protein isoforms 1/2/3/4/5-like isoform X11 n=1 Tax=Penaeus japonicus TaxID=27405 RepID=UPI000F66D2E7|nr:broad-complex core protein isoforms 1/2/3/4/5-like [Penaeus vannamei]XP_042881344.1 broad-complex core protein isoforms 1/2/3/4/5-like isoform X11 [Penaeus japonicus]XP_047471713.1 broad-complex core protein isoforms 1/2/3/4/5-like isoform X15 [Penaeus chinensis]
MCGKMAEELLSLKWNNHQAHFVDILTFLREQEIFVDATLACGGKLYAAHKFVLSTCSDYFKQMFTKNPSKHPIVFMKDVTSRDLEALLDFMYNGEVNVPQSSLGSLIKTAEGLQIKGLAVPDDPPVSKRERERDREKKDSKTQHEHHSPPAKRARPRERSPPHSTPSQPPASLPQSSYTSTTPTVPRSRSPQPPAPSAGASQIGIPPVEATLDEDSRTSVQSGVSGLSEQNSSTTPSLSSKQGSSQPVGNTGDNASQLDQLPPSHSGEEPSPGPSGIHKPQQSKEEPEMEIKQEDVVDLGEEDEGDWGVEGDGGGGDSSVGSENHPNFPEVMLPHTDGSMPPSGDPAMGLMAALNYHMAGLDEETLRPHQCVYCGRRFKRKDHRIEHERIHTGERPYACRLCGRAFVQKHQLMSHVRRKHAATDPTIPRPYPPAPPPPAPPSHLGRGVGDQQSQY